MAGFLLLDDAADEATRRLQEYGQGLLKPLQQTVQTGVQTAQDVTQRLQDYGQQQLQSLTAPQQQTNPMVALNPTGQLQDITQRLQGFGQQQLQNAQQAAQQGMQQLQPLQNLNPSQQQSSQDFLSNQQQPTGDIDASSHESFVRTLTPYAQKWSQQTGLPASYLIAWAASESNWGKAGNALFGIKQASQAGTAAPLTSGSWEYGQGATTDQFANYQSPDQAFDGLDQFLQGSRYRDVYNQLKSGQIGPDEFMRGINARGYATDPVWGNKIAQIANQSITPLMNQQQSVVGNIQQAGQNVIAGARQAVGNALPALSQFGDKELTAAEAYAACGPAAAVRFATLMGRQPTLREATDLARSVGWTPDQGMAGLGSESRLFDKLGIPHRMVGPDWNALAHEASSGNPVTLSTPGHYFTADNYDASSGAFHVGSSGTDLRGGSEWMTPAQMESRMGRLQGGMAVDNPQVPGSSPLASGGASAMPGVTPPQEPAQQGARRGMQLINDTLQPGGPVGDYFNRLGTGAQQVAQHAIQNPLTPLITPQEAGQVVQQDVTSGTTGKILQNDQQMGQDLATAAINKARSVGWNPTPEQEQFARTAVSTLTPLNVSATLAFGPEGLIPRLATSAEVLGTSALGTAAGEAVAPNLPEPLRPFAPAIGGFVAPITSQIGRGLLPSLVRGGAARAPVSNIVGEAEAAAGPPPAPNTTRVYHGTSSEFARPDPAMLSEESLYGPGYYLTDEPRVAGGTVAQGGEQVGPPGLVSPVKRPAGAVTQRGYAQEAMPPGFDERALAVDEERATNRLAAAQQDLEYARQNRNPIQETEAQRHIDFAQRDLDEIARDRAAALNEPAGPNVRPVDMPNDLKLLDAEAPVHPDDLQAIRKTVVDSIGASDVFDRQLARYFDPERQAFDPISPSGKQVWEALTAEFGRNSRAYATANRILADAGYDGIRYPGGTIMPIVDEAGNAIRHNAYVIFPESLDKLTNAAAGTRGGLLPAAASSAVAPFARRAVGSLAGGAAGYATAPEGATEQERMQRAAVGAGAGLGLATGLESLGLVGRAGVRRALTPEELRVAPAEGRVNPLVARLAAEAGAEEAAAEKVFSGPIADRLNQVAQQPVTPQEVEDARQALAQLASRGDRITGVPQQFSTPQGLAQLRARLRVLAQEGATEKDWYSNSSRSILDATGNDKQEAERIAQLVAIYSPNTPVDSNLNNALMAYAQWKTGVRPEDFKVAMGAQDKRAVDLLYHGTPWEGRKTNNFYRNLMQHIDHDVYTQLGKETGQSGVTADIWMMRAFDYLAGPNNEGRRWLKAPSDQQYNFIQDEVSRLGKELGWTPEQVQAAVWSSTKAAAEGTGITEAGFHYGTALENRMAQVSYTASPGSTEAQRVPGYMQAPDHEKAAYNLASESGFLDPVTGRDQAAEAAGILRGRTLDVPEVYGGYVGPGLQAEVPAPAARTSRSEPVFDPVTGERLRDAEGKLVSKVTQIRENLGRVFGPARDQLNAFAAFRGVILKQDAVPWTRMFFSNAPLRDANLNQVHIGRPLTTDEAQQLNQALIEQLGGDGKHAVVATPDGAWVLNLQGEFERNPQAPPRVIEYTREVPREGPTGTGRRQGPGKARVPATREENVVGTWLPSLGEDGKPLPFADNPSFKEAVKEALAKVNFAGDPDAHLSPFRADGEYVFNDWEANPNGEGYRSLIESSGRAQAFADVEAAITRRVRKAQADTAARFGWPADPSNPFARAVEPGATAERGLPGAAGAEPGLNATVGPRAPPEGAPTPELPTTAGADIRSRLQNFLTGEGSEAGSINPMVGARLGGAVAGGLAGNASTDPNAGPLERAGRIAGGAALGAAAPSLIARPRNPVIDQALLQSLRSGGLLSGPGPVRTARGPIAQLVDYSKQAMLSNPSTLGSNPIGNLLEILRSPVALTLGGRPADAAAGIAAVMRGMPEAGAAALDALRGAQRATLGTHATNIPLRDPIYRILSAADQFTRILGEYQGLAEGASRSLQQAGIHPNDPAAAAHLASHAADLIAGASRRGGESVFATNRASGANFLDNLMNSFSHYKEGLLSSPRLRDQALGALLDFQIPFGGVPSRMAHIALERSPGISQAIGVTQAMRAIGRGDVPAMQKALGTVAMETMLQGWIAEQIRQGNIRGPDDPDHPNSAQILGNWVNLGNLYGGYALPAQIMAAFAEGQEKAGRQLYDTPYDEATARTFGGLQASLKPLSQALPGENMIHFLAGLGSGQGLESATRQQIADAISRITAPGAAKFAEDLTDPMARDVSKQGISPQALIQPAMSRIPGLAGTLPEKIDPTTGLPMEKRRAGLGTLVGAESFKESRIAEEINALRKAGYTDLSVPKTYPDAVTIAGSEVKLKPDEQRAVTRITGKVLGDFAARLDQPAYKNATPERQARMMQAFLNASEAARVAAVAKVLGREELQTRIRRGKQVVGRNVNVGTYTGGALPDIPFLSSSGSHILEQIAATGR